AEQNSLLLPVSYDFSLPGQVLNVSVMVKIKATIANNRAIQIGFVTATNVALNATPLLTTMVTPNGVGYMSAILQSATNNAGPPIAGYQLRILGKPVNGTSAQTEVIPINNPTNVLTTNNWYKLVAKFT